MILQVVELRMEQLHLHTKSFTRSVIFLSTTYWDCNDVKSIFKTSHKRIELYIKLIRETVSVFPIAVK